MTAILKGAKLLAQGVLKTGTFLEKQILSKGQTLDNAAVKAGEFVKANPYKIAGCGVGVGALSIAGVTIFGPTGETKYVEVEPKPIEKVIDGDTLLFRSEKEYKSFNEAQKDLYRTYSSFLDAYLKVNTHKADSIKDVKTKNLNDMYEAKRNPIISKKEEELDAANSQHKQKLDSIEEKYNPSLEALEHKKDSIQKEINNEYNSKKEVQQRSNYWDSAINTLFRRKDLINRYKK